MTPTPAPSPAPRPASTPAPAAASARASTPAPAAAGPSASTPPPAAAGALTRTRPLTATLLTAAVLALAPAAAGPAHAMGVPRTFDRLTVSYDDGAGHFRTYRITCGIRREDAACGHLDSIGGPLPPVDAEQVCTMIYGGPQTARIAGSWSGRPVTETYRRTNGCEISRWHRMEPALPDPRTGTGQPAPLRG